LRQQLYELLEKRVYQCVTNPKDSDHYCDKITKKKEGLRNRNSEILKANAKGKIYEINNMGEDIEKVKYQVHFQYFIKQKNHLYLEEEVECREAEFHHGTLVSDEEILPYNMEENRHEFTLNEEDHEQEERKIAFQYNRLKAVQYAERWGNNYNPAYQKFENDCTNFISQCLEAGGAPMIGYPSRRRGWWMRNNIWSYSWTVAHTLRMYLPKAQVGLKAKEIANPEELLLGDIICYDFEGDGRYNHITIVTGRDAYGLPLVNAHTTNSRMRYWSYEDSTAYTPNIIYKFLTIEE
jgi:hypothetical protein